MKTKIIIWLTMLFVIIWTVAGAYGVIQLCTWKNRHQQLDDCRFEVNHLQTQLNRLREMNDYIPALEQLLNPLQLAELKTLSEVIRQKKYKEYERVERPIEDSKRKHDYNDRKEHKSN